MSSKKELRAEIDRLAAQVAAYARQRESRELAFWDSIGKIQENNRVTLVMANGDVVPGIAGQVNISRTDHASVDVAVTIYPQPPR